MQLSGSENGMKATLYNIQDVAYSKTNHDVSLFKGHVIESSEYIKS